VILNINGGPYESMELTFIDPDGPGNKYYIEAQIIRSDFNGNVAAVSGVLSSNSAANSSVRQVYCTVNHRYDFGHFYYFVKINIFRADTNSLPIFYGMFVNTATLLIPCGSECVPCPLSP
jgi:hypothetical protein